MEKYLHHKVADVKVFTSQVADGKFLHHKLADVFTLQVADVFTSQCG